MWYQNVSDYPVTQCARASGYPVTRNSCVSDYTSLRGVFAHKQNDVNIQKRSAPPILMRQSPWDPKNRGSSC
jgi:hypothetical protein